MAFQLIPFPISVLFGLVFAVAWIVVLYKLRRNGKIYSILFKASLIAGLVLLAALFYTIMSMLD